eukprot:CCRYP_013688-RA/>CCRYP_013688-RA protein AED:0.40 eAED:0.40 QI:0/0/0/1/1/1/2/0/302
MKDIPVARCATAYTHPATGTTYILVFNEALYFGKSMDHSLINPNQVRNFGIPVSDNPFDMGRPFGIDHEDLFVSFQTKGSTVCFDTRVPSDDKLESCKFVELTEGDTEWNPREVDKLSNRPADGYDSVKHLAAVSVSADQRSYGETDAFLNSVSTGLVPHAVTASASSTTRHSAITPEHISRLFGSLEDLTFDDPAYSDGSNTPTNEEYGYTPEEEVDDSDLNSYDKFIRAKIRLTDDEKNGGNIATIRRARATDFLGKPLGKPQDNPMLDSRVFEVELEDGTVDRYCANQIAECIWAQVDS